MHLQAWLSGLGGRALHPVDSSRSSHRLHSLDGLELLVGDELLERRGSVVRLLREPMHLRPRRVEGAGVLPLQRRLLLSRLRQLHAGHLGRLEERRLRPPRLRLPGLSLSARKRSSRLLLLSRRHRRVRRIGENEDSALQDAAAARRRLRSRVDDALGDRKPGVFDRDLDDRVDRTEGDVSMNRRFRLEQGGGIGFVVC